MTDFRPGHDWINQRVCVKKTLLGTLKYFGETSFGKGLWCGIELDNPLGKNDGMVKNVRYFACDHNYGLFVPVSKVTKIGSSLNMKKSRKTKSNAFKAKNCVYHVTPDLQPEEKTFVCVNLTDTAVELCKEKLLNLRLASEESLGILHSDTINDLEKSWNSLINRDKGDSVFLQPMPAIEGEDPKYTSTPRIGKKFKFSTNILESFDEDISEETNFKEFCNLSDVLFSFDKFKNDSLSSKTANSYTIPNDHEFNSDSPDSYSRGMNQPSLNPICVIPDQDKSSVIKDISNETNETNEKPKPNLVDLNQSQKLIDYDKLEIEAETSQTKPCENLDDFEKILKINIENVKFNATYNKFEDSYEKSANDKTINLATNSKIENSTKLDKPQNFDTGKDSVSNRTIKQDSILKKTYVLDSSTIKELCESTKQTLFISSSCSGIKTKNFSSQSKSSSRLAALDKTISLADFSKNVKSSRAAAVFCNKTFNAVHKSDFSNHKFEQNACKKASLPFDIRKRMFPITLPNISPAKNLKPFNQNSTTKASETISKSHSLHSQENKNERFRFHSKENIKPSAFSADTHSKTRKTSKNCFRKEKVSKDHTKAPLKARTLTNLNVENSCKAKIGFKNVFPGNKDFLKNNGKGGNQRKSNSQPKSWCKTLHSNGFLSTASVSKLFPRSNHNVSSVVGSVKNETRALKENSKAILAPVFKIQKTSGSKRNLPGKIQRQRSEDSVNVDKNDSIILSSKKIPIAIIKANNALIKPFERNSENIRSQTFRLGPKFATNGLQTILETATLKKTSTCSSGMNCNLRPLKPIARNSKIPRLVSLAQTIPRKYRWNDSAEHLKVSRKLNESYSTMRYER